MSDVMVPKGFGPAPKILEDIEDDNVASGILPSFAVLAIPGKVWTMRYKRNDEQYVDQNGDPINSIEVAIVRSRENLSKAYYIGGYKEGARKPPDCFATDGVVPDQNVPDDKRQNPTCDGCKWNEIGSAHTDTGSPTKACRDTRKIALIPIVDLAGNYFEQAYGGPMLFQLPPSSLKNYVEYQERLKAMGYKTFNVVTRMRFDPAFKFQKIVFSPFRALTDEEAIIIKVLRNDPRTLRVLSQEPEIVNKFDIETEGETETAQPKVQPKAPPKAAVAKAVPAAAPPPSPPPPPSRPSGVAATPQTVAEAVNSPASRPATARIMQTAPRPIQPQEEPEELLDEESGPDIGDSLPGELDDALKQLLGR